MLKFPSDFAWGAATSGPQSEGTFKKKHQNVFDYWYANDPDKFYDGVGPDTASNFFNDYKEDLALMRKAGIKSLRTSIQWSRLIDDLKMHGKSGRGRFLQQRDRCDARKRH